MYTATLTRAATGSIPNEPQGRISLTEGCKGGEDPRNHGPNFNPPPAMTAGYYPDHVASFAGQRLRFESKLVDQRRTRVNGHL